MEENSKDSLIKKYLQNRCTPEEKARVERWYLELGKALPVPDTSLDYAQLEETIWDSIGKQTGQANRNDRLSWVAAAAVVFLVIGLGLYLFPWKSTAIRPGTVKASLLTQEGVLPVLEKDQSQVELNLSAQLSSKDNARKTLITPKGGEYTLTLPDGSLVRLNADSRLDVAADFMQGDSRLVHLEGEAYFQVQRMPDKPFRVQVGTSTIEVLGTHFNVRHYQDDPVLRTTLLEGSIAINNSRQQRILEPGEQALIQDGETAISVEQGVDTAKVMAWTQGHFAFKNDRIDKILQEFARWYQIEIVYPQGIPNKHLTGTISRNSSFDEILQMLQYSGVSYELNDRSLTIFN